MDGWVVTRIIISPWLDLVSAVTSAVVVQLKPFPDSCTAARISLTLVLVRIALALDDC
jgi:beta-phosphoglucomutase-like phosphatase (HAD superfamily)